jgi:hypothetical protein
LPSSFCTATRTLLAATIIESIFCWKIHVPRIESQELREIFCVFLVYMIRIVAFIDNHFKKELYEQKEET